MYAESRKRSQLFDPESSLREVPEHHKPYMTFDCVIKGVKGNGACFYLAICQELWGSVSEWKRFRKLCHEYIANFVPVYYHDQLISSFPRTLIVGVGAHSSTLDVPNADKYLGFLSPEESLVSFVEMEFDMQKICDVFNVNLDIFYYGNNENIPIEVRQGWRRFRPNPDVVCQSNHRISETVDHTIYLYYDHDTHYETLIARPITL